MRTKQINKIVCIISAFVVIAFLFSLPVFAETIKCPMCGENHETGSLGSWKFVFNMFKLVHGGNSIKELGLSGILGLDVTSGQFASVWSTMETAYTGIKVIGLTLVIIFFFTELYDLYAEDRLNAELFVRAFIKLVASVIIIENGFKIVEIFIGMATLIFGKLQEGTAEAIAANHCNFEYLCQASFWMAIGELGKIIIPYAALSVALMVMQFFCYLRLIDVFLKTLFAPIGMADLGFKGTSGNGWRYLKKLMASALQGAVMLGILFVQTMLSASANWFVTLILYIAMIVVFRKAASLANDMLGV